MKKKYFIIVVTIVAIIGFQSFRNLEIKSGYHTYKTLNPGGAANGSGGAKTGAPGEETCTDCHSGGTFAPAINLVIKNSLNNTVVSYNPGETYTLTFTISGTSAPRFGMQATSLDMADSNIGTFSSPSANAVVRTLGLRTYFEHKSRSTASTFTSQWKAPVANTGTVTFYYSGLAVNNANGTNGDNGVNSSLQFTESALSTSDFNFEKAIKINQNPVNDILSLSISEIYEKLNLEIFDTAGKKVYEKSYTNTNDIAFNFNAGSGVYFLKVTNENNASAKLKFIKE